MIIISQDKTMILNFEYIETIEIENPLENNDGKFKILCDTTSDNQYTIAEYEKEERAKEVLREIIKRYDSLRTNTIYSIADKYYPVEIKSYYEMPKE